MRVLIAMLVLATAGCDFYCRGGDGTGLCAGWAAGRGGNGRQPPPVGPFADIDPGVDDVQGPLRLDCFHEYQSYITHTPSAEDGIQYSSRRVDIEIKAMWGTTANAPSPQLSEIMSCWHRHWRGLGARRDDPAFGRLSDVSREPACEPSYYTPGGDGGVRSVASWISAAVVPEPPNPTLPDGIPTGVVVCWQNHVACMPLNARFQRPGSMVWDFGGWLEVVPVCGAWNGWTIDKLFRAALAAVQ